MVAMLFLGRSRELAVLVPVMVYLES